jgi:hypothetical protein
MHGNGVWKSRPGFVWLLAIVVLLAACSRALEIPAAPPLIDQYIETLIPVPAAAFDEAGLVITLGRQFSVDDRFLLTLLDTAGPEVRWQQELTMLVEGETSPTRMLATGQDRVYAIIHNLLYAVDIRTGESLWRQKLPAAVNIHCATCLYVDDRVIVVMTDDQSIEAFRLDGRRLWQAELHARLAARQGFWPSSIGLMHLDSTSETANDRVLRFIDPLSGEQQAQIKPACEDPEAFFSPAQPDWDDPLHFSTDGESLYLVYEGIRWLCAQRYDLDTLELVWEEYLPQDYSLDFFEPRLTTLLTDEGLFAGLTVSSQAVELVRFDLQTGEANSLYMEMDYQRLAPIAVLDDIVYAQLDSRSRGEPSQLFAFDMAAYEGVTWTYPLTGSDLEERWITIRTASRGVVVNQLTRDPYAASIIWLDPQTGKALDGQETRPGSQRQPFMDIVPERNMVYFTPRGGLSVMDLESGEITDIIGRELNRSEE